MVKWRPYNGIAERYFRLYIRNPIWERVRVDLSFEMYKAARDVYEGLSVEDQRFMTAIFNTPYHTIDDVLSTYGAERFEWETRLAEIYKAYAITTDLI